MKKYLFFNFIKAQAMLEYLILSIFVAAVVFAALNFSKSGSIGNALIAQTQSYYQQGYKMIKDGKSKQIHGGWCEWSSCVNGYQERDCACPRPAFDGKLCSGVSFQTCKN